MTLVALEVGKPWPYPLAGDGLQAAIDPAEQGLSLTLVAAVGRPTPSEIAALTEGPIRLGVLSEPPLVWIVVAGRKIDFDAPYGVGLPAGMGLAGSERAAAVLRAAELAHGWSETTRGLLTIAVVDTGSRLVRGLRGVTCSRTWWRALADGLAACPAVLTQADYDAAIARDYRRWPDTAAMLAAGAAVEVGGAV